MHTLKNMSFSHRDNPAGTVQFSIIIPTLNEEDFLPLLLENLATQTEGSFEVRVADGGSTDGTVSRAKSYRDRLNIATHVSKVGNVAHQRNLAAAEARGEYLVFLDADSQVENDFVKNLAHEVARHPHGIYITYFHPDSNAWALRTSYWIMNQFVALTRFAPRPLSSVGSVMIERGVFEKIGGYDESIYVGEDHNLVRRARQSGARVHAAHSLRVTFSLRRIRHEGMLRSLYILVFGIGYALLKGDIRRKYFSYDMGGAQYSQKSTSQTKKQ